MAEVLPFPPSRRRDLIRKQALWYAGQAPRAAERNLDQQIALQRETLIKKGVDPVRAERETDALRGAIRAEVWRNVLTPDHTA